MFDTGGGRIPQLVAWQHNRGFGGVVVGRTRSEAAAAALFRDGGGILHTATIATNPLSSSSVDFNVDCSSTSILSSIRCWHRLLHRLMGEQASITHQPWQRSEICADIMYWTGNIIDLKVFRKNKIL